jgi:NAD(P)-dependent dehydrogenase (short-subunit alcohol dehydrogenase family)
MVHGPVNHGYLGQEFCETLGFKESFSGLPTEAGSGSRNVIPARLWFAEPPNKELGTLIIPDMANVAIIGGSRGIGEAVARHLVAKSERLLSVSRSVSKYGEWIKADVSTLEGVNTVAEAAGEGVLDSLLYMGGTWETNAFTSTYSFTSCSDDDIARVLNVNLMAPIRIVKALLPALRKSSNPKIIFMGALSGRDNFPSREVANSASKFGLRGVVHSLREELRPDRISVTVINPGNVGTPEVLSDLAEIGAPETNAIPLQDLLMIIDCVLCLSRQTCIKETDVPAMSSKGA